MNTSVIKYITDRMNDKRIRQIRIHALVLLSITVCFGAISLQAQTNDFTTFAKFNTLNGPSVSDEDLVNNNQPTFLSSSTINYTAGAGSGGLAVINDGISLNGDANAMFNDDCSIIYSVLFTLDTSINTTGYDISQINVTAGTGGVEDYSWMDYDIFYSTVLDPAFTKLTSVLYDQAVATTIYGNGDPANYIQAFTKDTILATGVSQLRFDIRGNPGVSHQVTYYQEIDVFSTITPVPEPQTYALLGMGMVLLGAGIYRARVKNAKSPDITM